MKWQYKIRKHPKHLNQEKMLNTMGEHGWELIAVDSDVFYFKRPMSVTQDTVFEEQMDKIAANHFGWENNK